MTRIAPATSTIVVALLASSAGAAEKIAAGTYHAPGDSGTLTFKPGKSGATAFHITSVGANGHMCEVEGEVPPGKDEVSLPAEGQPCVIRFRRLPDGFSVEVPETNEESCHTFCGMRAWFPGEYVKPEPACLPKATRRAQAEFRKAYAARDFAGARALLAPLVERCEKHIGRQRRGFIRNDLALTLHHLGDDAACEKMLAPLVALAKQTDDEVSESVPPADRDDELRLARNTRTNLKLCSAPAP